MSPVSPRSSWKKRFVSLCVVVVTSAFAVPALADQTEPAKGDPMDGCIGSYCPPKTETEKTEKTETKPTTKPASTRATTSSNK